VVKRLAGRQNCSKFGLHNLFLYRKIFGLRACEHRQLSLSNFVIENISDKDKEVQRRTIAEKFVLANSTFTNCSFNILFAGNK
jgi:hypothetical protein